RRSVDDPQDKARRVQLCLCPQGDCRIWPAHSQRPRNRHRNQAGSAPRLMSGERPPASSAGGLIGSVVERVLAFLDRPWKAVALALLLVVGGTGWVIWTERERLFDVLLAPRAGLAVFRLGSLPEALTDLLWQTTADLVTVWTVAIDDNAV